MSFLERQVTGQIGGGWPLVDDSSEGSVLHSAIRYASIRIGQAFDAGDSTFASDTVRIAMTNLPEQMLSPERLEAARRLRAARKHRGYENAESFARKLDIKSVTYRKHETGERGLTNTVAKRYASALGVDVKWLQLGELPTNEDAVERYINLNGEDSALSSGPLSQNGNLSNAIGKDPVINYQLLMRTAQNLSKMSDKQAREQNRLIELQLKAQFEMASAIRDLVRAVGKAHWIEEQQEAAKRNVND